MDNEKLKILINNKKNIKLMIDLKNKKRVNRLVIYKNYLGTALLKTKIVIIAVEAKVRTFLKYQT
ncbi:hypothetical protein PCC7424_0583 [Gloeothece citriformis PCC 7424]|uniref:Uncharacterized protein n=1 Tax=Gloeothece citriformis (strain PCC 7424) TaxID=65393 RepID=B7KEL9_GLOC7|nr:hypothetical protein [Gloeothece citriformis]ACK69044.1 hypothetical protein PCC7424_0583 [Gloeothece citriformis PCC 7424]